ncbi:hypothetical protein [Streptomyces boluensis]|uniref:Uncharacterized protein n=1 Tax=Streptomyces boluensis TaxID=1775135 RepID=A0A964XQ73_9ACTN|nr:hypothetical protein [Streptomyces boluensis]NBE55328.1 hypothetical protein [Streptomyces boluensis]
MFHAGDEALNGQGADCLQADVAECGVEVRCEVGAVFLAGRQPRAARPRAVQVRQYGTDALSAGSTGLLYAYDDAGEFFWVAAHDTELGSAALDRAPRTRRA